MPSFKTIFNTERQVHNETDRWTDGHGNINFAAYADLEYMYFMRYTFHDNTHFNTLYKCIEYTLKRPFA